MVNYTILKSFLNTNKIKYQSRESQEKNKYPTYDAQLINLPPSSIMATCPKTKFYKLDHPMVGEQLTAQTMTFLLHHHFSNIPLMIPFSNTLSLHSSLNVSQPYSTKQII